MTIHLRRGRDELVVESEAAIARERARIAGELMTWCPTPSR